MCELFMTFSNGIFVIDSLTNHRQQTLGVQICWDRMMIALLVKVRLWLFTLNGGIERFQIPLSVWHCVVCLEKWKKQREKEHELHLT